MNEADLGRLRWRCRRGMKELDELLLAYLPVHIDAPADDQAAFDALLDLPDPDLYRLVLASERSPEPAWERVLERLRQSLPHRA
ncbi:MAG TPA: succinate dehydrogenase assembly factor 2 [Candidatus Acidoferrales bacterium]|nr:succinate dehydrogenase assembly factor 2 [Candidatus Acidoferrales bacterium]